LWIHAASVGEAGIAFSMAGEVKKVYPDSLVFVSTITATGLERVSVLNESQNCNSVDSVFLAPVDCPFITNKFMSKVEPTSDDKVMNWLTGAGQGASVMNKLTGVKAPEVKYWGDAQAKAAEAKKAEQEAKKKAEEEKAAAKETSEATEEAPKEEQTKETVPAKETKQGESA